jgi:hypothetical protein
MWMPSELTRERVLRAAAKREPAIGSETSIVQCSAPVEWIEAAAEDGKPSLKQFSMLAYTGGSMEGRGLLAPGRDRPGRPRCVER